MPLVPLAIPPGVYRNGTDYQSSGRWRDASLIRWSEGAMQPIGGWVTRVTVSANKKVRGSIAWSDNSADRWMAAGTKDEVDDEGNPKYQGIDQSKLVPLLTAALQEALTKIEDLETRIVALEAQ